MLGPLVLVGAIATLGRRGARRLRRPADRRHRGVRGRAGLARWRPVPGIRRGLSGALAAPGVRTLLVLHALVGISFGAIEVAPSRPPRTPAPRARSARCWRPWGLASMAGGALAVRAGAPRDPVGRLVTMLAALAAGDALLLAAGGPLALAALLVVAGLAIAPAFAVAYAVAAEVARPGTVTEAFTWLTTGLGAGLAAGSAFGGALAAAHGAGAGFAAAALTSGLAAVVARLRGRTLGPDAVAVEITPVAGAAAAASPASP